MTHTKSRRALAAITASLGLIHAAQAGVEWTISVGLPGPAPVQMSAPVPVYTPAPVAAAVYNQPPALPNIEQTQAAQQARIQWGMQVGLITGHEHFRLLQTQQYIEQQRQWAYADGWLTYDEHFNLIKLLNDSAQHIERALANWQRVNHVYYPMPPVLGVWQAPRPHYGYGHGYSHGYSHGQRAPAAVSVQMIAPQYGNHGHRPTASPASPSAPTITQPQVLAPVQVPPKPLHKQSGDARFGNRQGQF